MKQNFIIGKYTLESLTNGMYASPLDMYREYVQNAVDSIDEAIRREIDNPSSFHIKIDIDSLNNTVTIIDNGVGIKSDRAVGTLLDIGNSQKDHVTARGFRGIGRLAGLSYCEKLIFKTSYSGENNRTIIEFDAEKLRRLLLPGSKESVSVNDVIDHIVTIKQEKESQSKRYFEVILQGVWTQSGITDEDSIREYLLQHAPLRFSKDFRWGRTVCEKLKLNNFTIPQYIIVLNGVEIFKPYRDSFTSDRVKKNTDFICDIQAKSFSRGDKISAILWYAQTNYYGTILDNAIKGIRIRQGNILIGDKGSCSHLFKEERFNGWMIGELHILDDELIVNSRRDGFEKNNAYYELCDSLKEWATIMSKDIRHVSYERSLASSQKTVAEAESLDDIDDINELCTEDFGYGEDDFLDYPESDELAEIDYISKLGVLLDQKKAQTKYAALNVNKRLTLEQRKVLERVFDILTQEYDRKLADDIVNTISEKY